MIARLYLFSMALVILSMCNLVAPKGLFAHDGPPTQWDMDPDEDDGVELWQLFEYSPERYAQVVNQCAANGYIDMNGELCELYDCPSSLAGYEYMIAITCPVSHYICLMWYNS